MKTCSTCKQEKELSEFQFKTAAHDSRNSVCKECNRQYKKEWIAKWRAKNPEATRAISTEYSRKWKNNNLERWRATRRRCSLKQGKKLKNAVIGGLGGECQCCGENRMEFLTLDHINGDGAEHRRKVGRGLPVYRDALKEGLPRDRYRVLCFNCNCSMGMFGYCPHEKERIHVA